MSDRELCHFTLKPIDDEKNTLKSFMIFDITSRELVFKVVVAPVTRTHDHGSNNIFWTMNYTISPQKPIGDEKDTLKSFMVFDITPSESVFRVVVGSQIVVPQHSTCKQFNN